MNLITDLAYLSKIRRKASSSPLRARASSSAELFIKVPTVVPDPTLCVSMLTTLNFILVLQIPANFRAGERGMNKHLLLPRYAAAWSRQLHDRHRNQFSAR